MKTIVLLHGHGVDASIWNKTKKLLSADYQILTPDVSLLTTLANVEDYADWLKGWLNTQKVDKCTLIGHSMGGYIALAFAEKYPTLLDGFGLFHSTAYADSDEKREQRKKTLRFIEEHGAAAFIKKVGPDMYAEDFAKSHPTVIKKHIDTYSKLPTDAVAAGFKAIMARPDRTAILEETNQAVLFILGDEDKLIALDKTLPITKLPKKSHTIIMKGVGHMGMVENPQEAAAAIHGFMNQ